MPCGTTRRSRFFLNSFLRFVAAAGFPGAAVASGTAPFCSFATVHSVSYFAESETLFVRRTNLACRGTIYRAPNNRKAQPFLPVTFFFAATAPRRGPFLVRAFVCVRCPRTG